MAGIVPQIVYLLCTVTSLASAFLLWRASRGRHLLFWSALFFVGMAINNILLFLDVWVGDQYDLALAPNVVALVSIVLLNFALIWDAT